MTKHNAAIPLAIAAIAITWLLLSCEDDNHRSDGSSDRAESADRASSTSTVEGSQGNNNSRGIWRTTAEPSSPEGATNYFPLSTNVPDATVDAEWFRQPDGTYLANGQVFTNCDELGFYFLSLPATNAVLVTNCGTVAFP